MNVKQRRFAELWIEKANIYEAAIAAGYSENYALKNAYLILEYPDVKAYIEELLERIKSEKIASATEVLEYLTSVLRGESMSEIVVVEGAGDGCSDARRMDKAPAEMERLKAAELLGKRYSLFTDKVENTGDINLNISVDYGDTEK